MKQLISQVKSMLKHTPFYQEKRFEHSIKTHMRRMNTEYHRSDYTLFYDKKDKIKQCENLFSNLHIDIKPGTVFQHWINEDKYCFNINSMIDNMPPNYGFVINGSLNDLKRTARKYNNEVSKQNLRLMDLIEAYIDRIAVELDHNHEDVIRDIFLRMKDSKARTLREGLQRVLFYSSLFWQTKHELVGLGRLDYILNEVELPDGDEESIALILEFYKCLHENYSFKSSAMRGDTGQVMVLGGLQPNGDYFYNRLTKLFIEALRRFQSPDPKIVLRTARNMPDELLELSLDCIATGIGSPLFSNDATVMPALQEYGYELVDCYNYVVSACWEPLVYGKSSDQNNLGCINFAEAVVNMYSREAFSQCKTWDEALNLYVDELNTLLAEYKDTLYMRKWERDPLLTLFTEGCLENGKDVSIGGAKYRNYGVLTVGMANAVDSLLNIKHLAFEDKALSLQEMVLCAKGNYHNKDTEELLKSHKYFGRQSEEVFELISTISKCMDKAIGDFKNFMGGRLKWGLSSPGYLMAGQTTRATLDGRKDFEALSVHISAPEGTAYTELINFAAELDYRGVRSNGNVVDFIVSPNLIVDNKDKFLTFLKVCNISGVFQMQMNVVSSDVLIKAKATPELFPNLIVRVWGFSAYFNDLPEEYKDVLIERAIASEKNRQ